ncbi:unnamed protein product, partial [Musa banksii]
KYVCGVPVSISRDLSRLGGGELDDESREDVVGVVDVRVALHDEVISALVAGDVQRLSLPYHLSLVARPLAEPPGPRWQLIPRQRAQQDQGDDDKRQEPRGGIGDVGQRSRFE